MTDDARRRPLAAAVLAVVDNLSASDLIAGVTPQRIGEELGYSGSSVRYQLSQLLRATGDEGTSWTFDRSLLWELILDDIHQRVHETTAQIRDAYLAAIDQAERSGDARVLVRAVREDLAAYAPGPAGSTNLSERSYLLAVAACDDARLVGDRLRTLRALELELYAPIYVRALTVTGRRMLPGESIEGVATMVADFLQGVAIARRYARADPQSDLTVARAAYGLFLGLTEPDPENPSAPFRALRCSGPEQARSHPGAA